VIPLSTSLGCLEASSSVISPFVEKSSSFLSFSSVREWSLLSQPFAFLAPLCFNAPPVTTNGGLQGSLTPSCPRTFPRHIRLSGAAPDGVQICLLGTNPCLDSLQTADLLLPPERDTLNFLIFFRCIFPISWAGFLPSSSEFPGVAEDIHRK